MWINWCEIKKITALVYWQKIKKKTLNWLVCLLPSQPQLISQDHHTSIWDTSVTKKKNPINWTYQ